MSELRQRQARVVRVIREMVSPADLVTALNMPDGYTLVGIVVGDQSTNITANATIELVFRSEVMEDVD
jgi:hypothetical protein